MRRAAAAAGAVLEKPCARWEHRRKGRGRGWGGFQSWDPAKGGDKRTDGEMPAELDGEAGEMKAEAQDVSNRLFLPKRLGKPTVGSLELEPRPLTLPWLFFTPQTWATPTLILLPSCGTQDPCTHSPSSECSCLLKDRTGVEMPGGW